MLLGDGTGAFTPQATHPQTGGRSLLGGGRGLQPRRQPRPRHRRLRRRPGDGAARRRQRRVHHTDTHPQTGNRPSSVAVGDFDRDGLPDLATADLGDDQVTVRLNTTVIEVTLSPPGPLAFGDVDIDVTAGTQTVTVTNTGDDPNTLASIALGGGDPGDFSSSIRPRRLHHDHAARGRRHVRRPRPLRSDVHRREVRDPHRHLAGTAGPDRGHAHRHRHPDRAAAGHRVFFFKKKKKKKKSPPPVIGCHRHAKASAATIVARAGQRVPRSAPRGPTSSSARPRRDDRRPRRRRHDLLGPRRRRRPRRDGRRRHPRRRRRRTACAATAATTCCSAAQATTICAAHGQHRLGGGTGADRVDGGAGNDLLDDRKLGGYGRDRLLGGSGNDRVRTAGSTADDVDCGPGTDSITLDPKDRQRRCERVTRTHA